MSSNTFINLSFDINNFNCAHLASKWFKDVVGADIPVPDFSVLKDWSAQQIFEYLSRHGFVSVEHNIPYQRGDGIIYRSELGALCGCVCIDDKIALLFGSNSNKSKLYQIDRIKNKLYHIRYKSVVAEGGNDE